MNAIVVGLGGRARSWVSVCGQSDAVDLVGYVEPVDEQREKAAADIDLPKDRLFPSLAEALKNVEAQFVIDVTPPAAHEAVATEAFDAGLDVLGEKPISDDFAAAKRIVGASEKAGRTHMITQNYRFGPVPRTTHRLLKEKVIGDPGQVSIGFYKAWATRTGTHYTERPFMFVKDMGVHHFDLMRYVLGRDPVRVWAKTWNQPWGWHKGDAAHTTIFEFEGGLMVTHHALACCVGKSSSWNGDWRIDGPEGSVTWEEDNIFITREYPGDRKKRDQIPPDDVPANGQAAILDEFLSAVAEGREPECSGRDNLKSLAMTFATVKSAEEGRWVEMSEILG
ncbi:MAG: Gfo/Idh/MocA family oxidoreductase [Planctomycetes bacterium]|nr:Gfo/Idh/MocA family oxidoreductase [Planctomycetota bacterium]